jgi:hypothetical protein
VAQNSQVTQKSPIVLETERLKAEADLEKARAERIKAWGIPSFEGKTSLGAGAGAVETALLATEALRSAAELIARAAGELSRPDEQAYHFLVLAGDENIDFSSLVALSLEAAELQRAFDEALGGRPKGFLQSFVPVGSPLAMVGAIAGLMRTDTTISGVDVPFGHRSLATAVAAELGERAILPAAISAGLFKIPEGDPPDGSLSAKLANLHVARDEAEKAGAADVTLKARLDPLIARHDAFRLRIATPDLSGSIPWVKAAAIEALTSKPILLLRVYVEKAGGSLVNRTNFWSWIGFDSVSISGGLVASYTILDPENGSVQSADVFASRSRVAGIYEIQTSRKIAAAMGSPLPPGSESRKWWWQHRNIRQAS